MGVRMGIFSSHFNEYICDNFLRTDGIDWVVDLPGAMLWKWHGTPRNWLLGLWIWHGMANKRVSAVMLISWWLYAGVPETQASQPAIVIIEGDVSAASEP